MRSDGRLAYSAIFEVAELIDGAKGGAIVHDGTERRMCHHRERAVPLCCWWWCEFLQWLNETYLLISHVGKHGREFCMYSSSVRYVYMVVSYRVLSEEGLCHYPTGGWNVNAVSSGK